MLGLYTWVFDISLFHIKKVCFYMAECPVHWTAQSALHFTTWQTCSFRHQLDFSEKHSAMQQLRAKPIHSHLFPPLSIARYPIIQLSGLRRRGDNGNAQTSKW